MSVFDEMLQDIRIPGFLKAVQTLPDEQIPDIGAAVFDTLDARGARGRIRAGSSVCIPVGSREIAHFPVIVKAVADYVLSCGAQPFIIPAMGSHGGATAEGQAEILRSYGITRDAVGAPVLSSMNTVEIGRTASGLPVHMDCYANDADFILPIGRIKPHTDFRGRVESGLCKMLTIGMGKQHGAYICHQLGFANMARNVWDISSVIVQKKPNIIALGILENSYHAPYRIIAVPGDCIHAEEPALLVQARALMGRLPFARADVLIVDEFGKDISGAGMDPNVTGRSPSLPPAEPYFHTIAVRDLTEKTHGNCAGIGSADVITRRVFDAIDYDATYQNAITAAEATATRIPNIMPNDNLAIRFAIRTAAPYDEEAGARVIWIKNTLSIHEFYISEALVKDAEGQTTLAIPDRVPRHIAFDARGNISGWSRQDI
jgi:hypothetical protein